MTNITRKTTSTTKTYDEEGRLITEEVVEEVVEEVEYGPAPLVPNVTPNTPWIITNMSANTDRPITKSDIDAMMQSRNYPQ